MADNKTFGQYLRELRKTVGVTQLALASFCDLSKQYISDIERGNNYPPDKQDLLDKISACLKLNEDQRETLNDRAAMARGDIASDIKKILINNPDEIKRLRRNYAK